MGVYEHTFKTPFAWEGKSYEKLVFDFDKLTGMDMIAIEDELQAQNIAVVIPAFSGHFLCRMAAKACGVGADIIARMPARDFNKIRDRARSFLLVAES